MNTSVVALILAAVALGVALFTLSDDEPSSPVRAERTGSNARVIALEAKVEELTRELKLLRARDTNDVTVGAPAGDGPADVDSRTDPADTAMVDKGLEAIVDKAVDTKTKKVLDEMRIKANKKPKMGVFASMLELNEEQRLKAERVIVEGQRKVHEVLNIPTADGTNLMDGLIEIMARGIAEPGKDHGWGKWIARAVGEKVPGMEVTYAAYIEDVKGGMRLRFKRDWTKEQYNEFEQWGVDPTEIAKVPGSPNDALGTRIVERARALGAEVPDEEE